MFQLENPLHWRMFTQAPNRFTAGYNSLEQRWSLPTSKLSCSFSPRVLAIVTDFPETQQQKWTSEHINNICSLTMHKHGRLKGTCLPGLWEYFT